MAQENTKKSNSTPFIIIGLIALATILGIYYVSQSGADPSADGGNSNTNSAGSVDKLRENYAKAPAGASPANMLGSESAAVIVEEFADFQCPTCATVHPKVKEVISQYGSKIKFVFRNFPLTQIHQHAYDAAVAAEAAGLQGKFWQMQDMIYKNQATWSAQPNARSLFKEYATTIGLDVAKFEEDSLKLVAKSRVDADMQRGRALNISSTPTILINGMPIPPSQLDVEPMKQAIDAELARISAPKPAADNKESDSKEPEKK